MPTISDYVNSGEDGQPDYVAKAVNGKIIYIPVTERAKKAEAERNKKEGRKVRELMRQKKESEARELFPGQFSAKLKTAPGVVEEDVTPPQPTTAEEHIAAGVFPAREATGVLAPGARPPSSAPVKASGWDLPDPNAVKQNMNRDEYDPEAEEKKEAKPAKVLPKSTKAQQPQPGDVAVVPLGAVPQLAGTSAPLPAQDQSTLARLAGLAAAGKGAMEQAQPKLSDAAWGSPLTVKNPEEQGASRKTFGEYKAGAEEGGKFSRATDLAQVKAVAKMFQDPSLFPGLAAQRENIQALKGQLERLVSTGSSQQSDLGYRIPGAAGAGLAGLVEHWRGTGGALQTIFQQPKQASKKEQLISDITEQLRIAQQNLASNEANLLSKLLGDQATTKIYGGFQTGREAREEVGDIGRPPLAKSPDEKEYEKRFKETNLYIDKFSAPASALTEYLRTLEEYKNLIEEYGYDLLSGTQRATAQRLYTKLLEMHNKKELGGVLRESDIKYFEKYVPKIHEGAGILKAQIAGGMKGALASVDEFGRRLNKDVQTFYDTIDGYNIPTYTELAAKDRGRTGVYTRSSGKLPEPKTSVGKLAATGEGWFQQQLESVPVDLDAKKPSIPKSVKIPAPSTGTTPPEKAPDKASNRDALMNDLLQGP